MTTRYFKSRKQDAKGDLEQGSAFMQQVARPEGINVGDYIKHRFEVIKHPTENEYALVTTGDIFVHPLVATAALGSGNFPAQDAFINNAGESARIKALIKDNPRVNGYDLAPVRWDEKTYEQLEAEGFFTEILI